MRYLFLIIFCLPFNYAQAVVEKENLANAFVFYKKGDYTRAIEELDKIKESTLLPSKFYLKGIAHNKLQEFEEGAKSLLLAKKFQNKSEDLFYELGQALYATNDLLKARKAFIHSYKDNYKPLTSLYYVGHISEILEQYKAAKNSYTKILSNSSASDHILQIASKQLAEVYYAKAQNSPNATKLVKVHILPRLEKALKIDPTSPLATEISTRIDELKVKYGLDPDLLANGKRLPEQKFDLSFRQKILYDENITDTNNDLPTQIATQEDSFVFESNLDMKYVFALWQRFLLTPGLDLAHTLHGNRQTSQAYQNDSYEITPATQLSWEHTLWGSKSSLIFEFEHRYKAKASSLDKTKNFYGRSNTMSFSYKTRFFSFGDTSFKYKTKDYISYDETYDSLTTSLSLTQSFVLTPAQLMMFFIQRDDSDAGKNPSEQQLDTTLLIARMDYILLNFYQDFLLNLSLTYTGITPVDEVEKSNRGTEVILTPTLKFGRKIGKNLEYGLAISYEKKDSQSDDYKYDKTILGLEFTYNL